MFVLSKNLLLAQIICFILVVLMIPYYRIISYVQKFIYLKNSNIKPVGVWPEGKLPNINNDTASTLLAKLEEKWLGLDR